MGIYDPKESCGFVGFVQRHGFNMDPNISHEG